MPLTPKTRRLGLIPTIFGIIIMALAALFMVLGAGATGRVTHGLQVLYTFKEGSGTTVYDVSGVGAPLDLAIADPGNVSWLPGGGLSLDSATIISSSVAAGKVISAAMATEEVSIEAWVKPANLTQNGPARIVTLSADTTSRNVTLGQG